MSKPIGRNVLARRVRARADVAGVADQRMRTRGVETQPKGKVTKSVTKNKPRKKKPLPSKGFNW